MSQSNQDDDAEAMQQAFQEFMLSGGGGPTGKKKKKGKKHTTSASPAVSLSSPRNVKTPSQNNLEHQRSVAERKTKKRYWQILNAFQKTLQEDWIEVDDHLGDVIASIVNLRDRIRMSSKHLWRYNQHKHTVSFSSSSCSFGYRNHSPSSEQAALGYLTFEDLEMALTHDMMKHEKMLAGSRRLLSSLNQAQEALGRRLDELLKFDLEASQLMLDESGSAEYEEDLPRFAAQIVDWCGKVFAELAQELYRKQRLVQTVLDSTTDHILYQEGDEDGGLPLLEEDGGDHEEALSPIKVAEKSHRLWPCGSLSEDGGNPHLPELLLSKPWEQLSANVAFD